MSKGQPPFDRPTPNPLPDPAGVEAVKQLEDSVINLGETLDYVRALQKHKNEGREFWKAAYVAAIRNPSQLGHSYSGVADDALEAFNDQFKP